MFTMVLSAKKATCAFFIATLLLSTGCANFKNKTNDSEEAYYNSAQHYLERKNYSMAIEQLTLLQDRFPFGTYAKASTLDLMYAHYQYGDYSEALIEADRFTRLNADHSDVDYAAFIRAMSYFQLYLSNRGMFNKVDPAIRSPEQGQRAFTALSAFLQRYPDSEYRPDIIGAMVVLKDALARHELTVADFYVRKNAWISALERAQAIVSHYTGVSSEADALVIMIEAYDALELPEDRLDSLNLLSQKYPDHAVFKSGEYKAPRWEEDRWWVKFFTLGLTS